MPKKHPFFSKKLITWYLENKRTLPWRQTKNPYYIWLSEIILQQTRVAQGTPYYLNFIERYPTVANLAKATEEEVLKLWQGLGYYSRARNLHFTAKYIANELNGVFPKTFSEIIQLKGIGDYTASAIASICFNEATAVVDGNVYRVLSRYYGIETPINSTEGIKEFKKLAQKLIDPSQPGTFNQAIMEFGARHCTPQNPQCMFCIFAQTCEANTKGRTKKLPVKLKKIKIKKRFFNFLVVLSTNNKTILQQRTQKGIWQSLYEFPLVETSNEVSLDQLKEEAQYTAVLQNLNIASVSIFNEKNIVHKLSHQHLYTKFWIVLVNEPIKDGVPISKIRDYPVPILIDNFINAFSRF